MLFEGLVVLFFVYRVDLGNDINKVSLFLILNGSSIRKIEYRNGSSWDEFRGYESV